ncbi:MAG TPA: PIN domain-containing protein [Bryobacteraceae bacterium]|nr:PIN domain-containing protein [Bryobacteraceae bacterium]
MRVYFDTGVFIDYLSTRGNTNSILRSSERRGRTPAEIAAEAERIFETVNRAHIGATSCLTYYEAEEALYRQLAQSRKGVSRTDTLLIPVARAITTQVQIVVEVFNISVLDLTSETVRLQLQQLDLQTRGIRAADALHAASAISFDADLLVSTDDGLLQLDGVLLNTMGRKILCRDTDSAAQLL